MNRKGQVNQIFVYVLSMIIVLFVGFLVVKFVISFSDDSNAVFEQKFYDTIDSDYLKVFRTYNEELVLDYKVQSKVESIKFMGDDCSGLVGEELILYENGDDIVIYSGDETNKVIESSFKLGEFDGCFEVIPDSNGRFTLAIENVRNEIIISEVQ